MTTYVPSEHLGAMGDHARKRLTEATKVIATTPPIDTSELYTGVAKWRRYPNVVAVCADLKGSTKLKADGMWDKSTAAIYDAAVEPMARIFSAFDCDFIDIQGDGGFALYTGDDSVERALCAAISVRTFSSEHLVPEIESRWSTNTPTTGYKLGVAASVLLAKKIGIPRTEHTAPVWAGRAVNYAAKCAQQAERHSVLITADVREVALRNDYLAFSCGCTGGKPSDTYSRLWEDTPIAHLDPKQAAGAKLESAWCDTCGDDFCAAILRGDRRRVETGGLRSHLTQELRASA